MKITIVTEYKTTTMAPCFAEVRIKTDERFASMGLISDIEHSERFVGSTFEGVVEQQKKWTLEIVDLTTQAWKAWKALQASQPINTTHIIELD